MSFEALPSEIIELVSSFVDRQELKALRETHRAFLVPASSRLFREIHISPNSYSFDRALAVGEDDTLRHLVRSLRYHTGTLGEFYAGFESFRHEFFSIRRRPGESRDPSEVTAEVLWCYNCWLEELDAQRTFELRDESEELQQLCSRFPRLEQIITLLDDIDDIAEPKDYIGLRTGMAASEDVGEYRFARLFRAVSGRSLTKIVARAIGWNELEDLVDGQDDGSDSFEELVLPNTLRYLELGLYNPLGERSLLDIQARCGWLNTFLSKAPSLGVLRIDFDELPFESHAELMLPISETIFLHQWTQLKDLKLEAIAAKEGELCDFLLAHAVTLRKLQLGDIELVQVEGSPSPPSVLRLFRRLRKGLQLSSFRITGNFTNRATQAWYVDIEVTQTNCLRDLIEAFVRRDTILFADPDVSPQPSKWFLNYMQSDDIEVGDWEEFCDESWYWSPELL